MPVNARSIGMIAIGGAVLGGLLYVTLRETPVPVDLHEVARDQMQITITVDGKTEIRNVYEIASPIAGTALRLPVVVGEAVTAGETVAVVEPVAPSLLDTRTRVQAEAAVRENEAALHVSESQLLQAEEDLAYAKTQFERVRTLVERGVSSVTQLEDAAQILAIKEAAHAVAKSRLAMSEGALERAKAALIEPNSESAANATCCVQITAPVDGVVLEIDVVSERPVAPGARLLSLGDPADLEIVADLLTSDAVRIAPGAQAIVERWGGPQPLTAKLRSVEPSARTKISALGIEEQRVDAVFDLTSPLEDRPGLGHGYAVFLRVIEWQGNDVLQAPLSAVFRRGTDWFVFVTQDGRVQLTPIEIGKRNGRTAEVLGGLSEGARVVTHPSDALVDGTLIEERSAF